MLAAFLLLLPCLPAEASPLCSDPAGRLRFVNGSLELQSCAEASASLHPLLKLNDDWLTVAPEQCQPTAAAITCTLADQGVLRVEADAGGVRLTFKAAKALHIQALGWRGTLHLPGAQGWLSNGFHSWSQSGAVKLLPQPAAADLDAALQLVGEDEVYRRGREQSWWYSYTSGGHQAFLAGASSAEVFKSWVQISRPAATPDAANALPDGSDDLVVQAVSGGLEDVALAAGGDVSSELWQFYLGDDLQAAQVRYAASLSSRRYLRQAPLLTGWNSWYDLWAAAALPDVLRDVTAYGELVKPRLPASQRTSYAVIDDGWQRAWGDWRASERFPGGVRGLVASLKQRGFATGLWLAPALVAADSPLVGEHPDWFMQGLIYEHPSGNYRVLDITHPGASAHLQSDIKRLVQAGVSLLKIDFLFAATLEGEHYRPATGMQAYQQLMQVIRQAAGPDTELIAVGAPPLGTLPYADAWRVGGDIAFTPAAFGFPPATFAFIANQARSVAARYPFCLAAYCDADPVLLRAPLTKDEVDTGAWVVSAAGGGLFLSDDLRQVGEQRASWLSSTHIALSLGGVAAAPVSFFPDRLPDELVNMRDGLFTAEHQVPSLWRFPDGRVMAINFNDDERPIDRLLVPAHAARGL